MNYQKIYNQIIETVKLNESQRLLDKKKGEYFELHHIVPKCIDRSLSRVKSNLVLLTPREHFICHRLLCEIYPNNKKIIYAFWMMCNGSNQYRSRHFIPSSKEYELGRKLYVESRKGIPSGMLGKPGPMRGRKHSEESKQKNREKHLGKSTWDGRKHTDESKELMSKSALTRKITAEGEAQRRAGISKNNRKPKSEEHRLNISKAKLGENNPMYGKEPRMKGKHYEKVKCPHCNKEVAKTKINLFHNDNCKKKFVIP